MSAGARTEAVLELRGIVKRFGPTVANAGADLDVRAGEIHAVLGENGAGKTTLMRIAAGLLQPDAGEIRWQGRRVQLRSPRDAAKLGIGLVHQQDMLVPGLTVAENLRLADPQQGPFLRADNAVRRFAERARRFRIEIDPELPVDRLTVGQRQWVSLLRILDRPLRLLALDEPTASLSPVERDLLFETLRELRKEGMGIVFISHKLPEVLALADRVTVMRAGRAVGTVPTSEATEDELARLMVGERLTTLGWLRDRAEGQGMGTVSGTPLLMVSDLRTSGTRPPLRGVSLEVRAGEIVGIGGVGGNGQDILFRCLAGLERSWAGDIRILGKAIGQDLGRVATRVARIPEDRLREALAGGMALWENVHLGRTRERGLTERGLWRTGRARRVAEELLRRFDVRFASVEQPAGTLSGGNQQRVVLARELGSRPDLVLAHNPTRGLDVAATAFVLEQLLDVRDSGGGVLLISYDLDELVRVADRILIMVGGEVVGSFSSDAFDLTEIGLAMGGSTMGRA